MEERVEEEEGGSASDEGGYQGWRWWSGGCGRGAAAQSGAWQRGGPARCVNKRANFALLAQQKIFPSIKEKSAGGVCFWSGAKSPPVKVSQHQQAQVRL